LPTIILDIAARQAGSERTIMTFNQKSVVDAIRAFERGEIVAVTMIMAVKMKVTLLLQPFIAHLKKWHLLCAILPALFAHR